MGERATRAASPSGFLLFFLTCHAARDVAQCHKICRYIFNPGGGLPYERSGDAGNFELDPLRRRTWAWANLFLTPKRDHFVTMFFRY